MKGALGKGVVERARKIQKQSVETGSDESTAAVGKHHTTAAHSFMNSTDKMLPPRWEQLRPKAESGVRTTAPKILPQRWDNSSRNPDTVLGQQLPKFCHNEGTTVPEIRTKC